MDIEKIVSDCLHRRRSQSVIPSKEESISKTKWKHQESLTFQPKINEMPKSMYRSTNKTDCSREQIIERLLTDRRSVEAKRTQEKLQQEEKEYKKSCTFQPETNPTTKRIMKTEFTEEDAFERLYTDGITKKKLSESFNYLEQNKENYSFQPQTNYRSVLNAETCNMKPIYERIDDVMREKKEKLKKMQENANQEELSSQPKINEISDRIVKNKDEFKKSILDRISGYIDDKRKKEQTLNEENKRIEMRECTFKPEINSSVPIANNFMERQEEFLRKQELKYHSTNSESFQPKLNKVSEILTREERENETMEEKLNRLMGEGTKKAKMERIERSIYQECTFEPEINEISKCISAQHVSHRCNCIPKEEEYEFMPKINKMSDLIVKQIKRVDSSERIEIRKESMNKMKMENEYREMKECTFKPRVNSAVPKNDIGLTDIRGFEGFNRKIDKINQIKESERERHEKLFNLEKKYKSRKSTTPTEFKLSQGYNLKEAVKQELEQKFEEECTFQPNIISIR